MKVFGKMGKAFRRKSKTSGELDVDTTLDSEGMETPRSHTSSASRANTLGRQVKSFSDGKAATPSSNISRASSFTAGESPPASTKSIETTPYKSEDREQKKSRGLFGMGARKDKGKGSERQEIDRLKDQLQMKTQEMDKLEEELEETKRKAREWKEYSNMQRFKTEVLVDMWVLRMVNGDGKLDRLPLPVSK